MRYNTGNPVGPDGSSSPFDLHDNAGIADQLVTGTERQYPNRLGQPIRSFNGMNLDFDESQAERDAEFGQDQAEREEQFQQFLLSSGYEDIGDYAAGLIITGRNQVFLRSGQYYRAKGSLALPYTTTGNWASESSSFVSVGDAVLRQDLAQPDGDTLVRTRSGRTQRQKNDEYATISDFQTAKEAADFAIENNVKIRVLESLVLKVPSDFPSLQSAIDHIKPDHGIVVSLVIDSGHQLASGLIAMNGDYSAFSIESEDSEVFLAEGFTGPTDAGFNENPSINILLLGVNSDMPVLNCLINAGGRCSHGYYANNSRGRVRSGKGVKNAGRIGLYAVTSIVGANGTVWTGAGQELASGFQVGIWATNGSVVTAQEYTNVSNSTYIGAGTSRGSILNAQRLIANGCEYGVEARRGFVDIQYANLKDNVQRGINAVDNVVVSAEGCTLTGMNTAIRVSGGASVNATSCITDSGSPGLSNMSTVSNDAVRPLRAFNFIDGGTVVNNNAPPQGAVFRSKSSDTAFVLTSFASDPHLQLSVRSGDVWVVSCDLLVNVGADTSLAIGIFGPAFSSIVARGSVQGALGSSFPTVVTAYDTAIVTIPGSQVARVSLNIRIVVTANGILSIRGSRLSGTGTASISSASMVEARREM